MRCVLKVATVGLVAMMASSGAAVSADDVTLPETMIWSAHQLGSSSHAEASAIANALSGKFDARVRIMPAGTSIGRLLPVKVGRASYGFLGTEAHFASEAMYDFAERDWGPQDLRVLLAKPTDTTIVVGGDTDIMEPSDLKGRRMGWVAGDPSVNAKVEALLAFGGLTWDDVQKVEIGSFGAQKDSMAAGQIDAFLLNPTSGFAREVAVQARGMRWLSFPVENEEGWRRLMKVAGYAQPAVATKGVNVSEENPLPVMQYRYPVWATYAAQPEEEVYNVVKAAHLAFDDYRQAIATSDLWAIDVAGRPVVDAPFHDGAIRLFKEAGTWRAEDQSWQDERLKRAEAVQAAWKTATEAYDGMSGAKPEWQAYWAQYRAEHL